MVDHLTQTSKSEGSNPAPNKSFCEFRPKSEPHFFNSGRDRPQEPQQGPRTEGRSCPGRSRRGLTRGEAVL